MNYQLQCKCGSVRGLLSHAENGIRGMCYCKDCRAYSCHLGIQSRTHDSLGGADFVAALGNQISITEGAQNIACISLSPNGLLRWYAKCCNTPIAGTPRNWKLPYVGLVRAFMENEPGAYESTFGDVKMRANTSSAKQPPPALALKSFVSVASLMSRVFAASIRGSYKSTPFFQSGGEPVVVPTVLSKDERARASADAE